MHTQVSRSEVSSGAGASSAWSKVAAFASAVDADLDRWLADQYRIGLTDCRALASLGQAPDKELRVSELAQRLGLNQSSATRLVSRLEAKDLVRRDTCPDDRRGIYAVLTKRGEVLLGDLRAPYEERVRELLVKAGAHFPDVDLRRLVDAIGEVRALLDR
ncbi:DNA-binding transcriptional regulator, MarR family [Actinopolymorpha cephalotaxi]|uniref:DNA-binding MarR family transcriptional regulator n=1 Tax=Actinopolymorpha cephalotaxi TaxID=504797 RepID=A0A1I2YV32_9ACTN|nr:MarR family transcriptional regulator [Actinopolymorpha cephalotaxi]NYH81712.1 DNA-binding MarR family transcriptional regulator [Actinopolymorpha cephalotaxi]SFH29492.1 DNA-binding transcriptional regulator, MarR family [Actinopolymorpha cephalotaxi]